MSDIVETLRDGRYIGQEGMRRQAADEIERLRTVARPSWDADEWQRAITCVAEQLAMFRNPDDPPSPNQNDVCAAGHIVGALLGQEFVALRGFVSVSAAPTTTEGR